MRATDEHGDSPERPRTARACRTHRRLGYLWRYESRSHRPLPLRRYLLRLAAHAALAAGLGAASVAVGLAGFMHYEQMAWRDALLETAMLLGGMGPTEVPRTPAGKMFASVFALYAGVVFIVTAAVLVTPVVHRVLHLFHAERDA